MNAAFQLGVITDEISQDIADAIRIARRYGLAALELRSVDGEQLYRLSDSRIEEIGAAIRAAGLKVSGLSAPVFKCNLRNAEEVAEHRGILTRYAELAQRLGTRHVRGFSFWAEGPLEEAFDDIVRELKGVVPILEQHGVIYALEADPAVYASNAAKAAALIRAVDSPYVQGLYDPGNDLWDPDQEVPYPDGYDALRGRICHIHLKDAVKQGDHTKAVAIGKGQVDYAGLLRRLVEEGYDGYLVVETHYRLQSSLTEEQLKRPAGYAFSEGGEEATIDCLNSLFELLERSSISISKQ